MSRGTIRYDNKTLRELDALEFYSNTAINTVPALERLHLGVPKESPAYVPGPARSEGRRPGMRGGIACAPSRAFRAEGRKHDRRSSRLRWRAGKTRIVGTGTGACEGFAEIESRGPSALRLPCRESCSPSRRCSWEQNPPDCAAIPWRCTEARRAVRRSRSVRKRGSSGEGACRMRRRPGGAGAHSPAGDGPDGVAGTRWGLSGRWASACGGARLSVRYARGDVPSINATGPSRGPLPSPDIFNIGAHDSILDTE